MLPMGKLLGRLLAALLAGQLLVDLCLRGPRSAFWRSVNDWRTLPNIQYTTSSASRQPTAAARIFSRGCMRTSILACGSASSQFAAVAVFLRRRPCASCGLTITADLNCQLYLLVVSLVAVRRLHPSRCGNRPAGPAPRRRSWPTRGPVLPGPWRPPSACGLSRRLVSMASLLSGNRSESCRSSSSQTMSPSVHCLISSTALLDLLGPLDHRIEALRLASCSCGDLPIQRRAVAARSARLRARPGHKRPTAGQHVRVALAGGLRRLVRVQEVDAVRHALQLVGQHAQQRREAAAVGRPCGLQRRGKLQALASGSNTRTGRPSSASMRRARSPCSSCVPHR